MSVSPDEFPHDRTTLFEVGTGIIVAPVAADAGDYLLVAEGEEQGRFIALDDRERAIGRVEPCEIVIRRQGDLAAALHGAPGRAAR